MNVLNDELAKKHDEWLKKLRAKELQQKELERKKRQPPARTPMSAEDREYIDEYIEGRTYVDQNYERVKLVKNGYTGVEPEDYKDLNPFAKGDSFNPTEQSRIVSSNPKLAAYLKEEALKDGKWHKEYKIDRISKETTKEAARREKLLK